MEALTAENEWHSAIGALKLLLATECSWLIRILDNADAESVAAAVALSLERPVQCILLDGDYFDADEGDSLSKPLRQGQTVVLVVRGPSPLPASIAEGWHAACECGDAHPGRNLRLHGRSANTTPGRLIIVHIMPGDSPVPRCSKVGRWDFSSIPMLTTDQKKSVPIVRVGVTRLPTTSHPTMKEVCMLHCRDPEGTPVRSIGQMRSSDMPLSWTDIQTLLRSEYDDIVRELASAGKFDQEKQRFWRAGSEFLEEQGQKGPEFMQVATFPDIYHVVWFLGRIHQDAKHIFRGQRDARWRLECTLLRPNSDGSLGLGEVHRRLLQTQAFIDALAPKEEAIFGRQLDDDARLAVAQHFSFATPLLDFSESFEVAAFFATNGMQHVHEADSGVGVIYVLPPLDRPLVPKDPGEPLGIKLLPRLGVRFGAPRVIAPNLPAGDDRIRRQKGLFLADFHARDLTHAGLERILFEQHAQVVYENPRHGISFEQLLPPNTELVQLGEEINKRFRPGIWPSPLISTLDSFLLPADTIVGSDGSQILAQMNHATDFFGVLRDAIDSLGEEKNIAFDAVRNVLDGYFQDIATYRDAGALPVGGTSLPAERLIFRAVKGLAQFGNVEPGQLLQLADDRLRRQEDLLNILPPLPFSAETRRQQIAVACTVFLCAWEQLRQVDGQTARNLFLEARIRLSE